jgi:hypothetical protein
MQTPATSAAQVYWAAEPKSEDLARKLFARVKRYREWLRATGRSRRAWSAWSTYYGRGPDGTGDTSRQRPAGERGELVDIATNDFAALVQQAHVMTVHQPPAFKTIAINTDFSSVAQTLMGDGLIDHYDRQGAVKECESQAVRASLLCAESWVSETWDAAAGRAVMRDPDTGKLVGEGDIRFAVHTPWDVAYDFEAQDAEALEWIAFRTRANRFRLAAQYEDASPLAAARLRQGGIKLSLEADENERKMRWRASNEDSESGDNEQVDVWELRHPPCPQLPRGRLVKLVDVDCVLFDSVSVGLAESPDSRIYTDAPKLDEGQAVADYGYPYDETHVYPMTPERMVGGIAGHTPYHDLLGLQQGLDTVATILATGANAGGLTNFWLPENAKFEVDSLAGGGNVICGPVKPEVLEGVKVDPQALEFARFCQEFMRRRVGFNDVALGEPTKGMPAQLAALLQAQAVEFHSSLQAAYYRLIAATRTGIIKMLKRYANDKRVALMSGKSARWELKEFTKQDIADVDRVAVEPVNPVMKTLAGRIDVGKMLLEQGDATPEQFLTLVNTGRLEPMFEGKQTNLTRIKREKEMLQDGIGLPPVQIGTDGLPALGMDGLPVLMDDGKPHIRPLWTDTHWIDIPEYLAVAAMPDARDRPEVIKAVMDIVEYKLALWRKLYSTAPELAALLGAPPPAPPPGVPGAPAGDSAMKAIPNSPSEVPTRPIKQPKPPPNPINGEQAPAPMDSPGKAGLAA